MCRVKRVVSIWFPPDVQQYTYSVYSDCRTLPPMWLPLAVCTVRLFCTTVQCVQKSTLPPMWLPLLYSMYSVYSDFTTHPCGYSPPFWPAVLCLGGAAGDNVSIGYTLLYCTELYCTALYYTTLHCTVHHCTALHFTALHCTTLH